MDTHPSRRAREPRALIAIDGDALLLERLLPGLTLVPVPGPGPTDLERCDAVVVVALVDPDDPVLAANGETPPASSSIVAVGLAAGSDVRAFLRHCSLDVVAGAEPTGAHRVVDPDGPGSRRPVTCRRPPLLRRPRRRHSPRHDLDRILRTPVARLLESHRLPPGHQPRGRHRGVHWPGADPHATGPERHDQPDTDR